MERTKSAWIGGTADWNYIMQVRFQIVNTRFRVFLDIGKLYSIMIEDCAKPGEEVQELIKLFSSFISDEISNFNTDLYCQNPDYLECSYREGRLLD